MKRELQIPGLAPFNRPIAAPSLVTLHSSLVTSPGFPFVAIVGRSAAQLALLLLAVDPSLKGVLIASGAGTAKTTLARGFQALLPRPGASGDPPFVEIPLNVSADRLLGSLDFERALKTGRRHLAPGLLRQVDGGVLYLDQANLIDSESAAHICNALDAGCVRVERDGFSVVSPSRFVLVASFDPGEGEVSPVLRDRIGLVASDLAEPGVDEREEILNRVQRFDRSVSSFNQEFASETSAIQTIVAQARDRLRTVEIGSDEVRSLCAAAVSLRVEGNRADIISVRAARASAALAGRSVVTREDVAAAMQLALLPRANTFAASTNEEESNQDGDGSNCALDGTPRSAEDLDPSILPAVDGVRQDIVVQAIGALTPEAALRSLSGKRQGAAAGRRGKPTDSSRGRYYGASTERRAGARVALDATLRAAAPHQLRRRVANDSGNVAGNEVGLERGESSSNAVTRRSNAVKISVEDLRFKRSRRRTGTLFIFVVDASGSMVVNRMAQAKGALIGLLQRAYLHRDSVALVSFRGDEASVLLAPTRSVEIARRLVDRLPGGGGTPIAKGLVCALDLARQARRRGSFDARLVLFTDGRANIALGSTDGIQPAARARLIQDELRQIGARLRGEGVGSVVIDTKLRFIASGEARALAETLGASYCYLPLMDSKAICEAISAAARTFEAGV